MTTRIGAAYNGRCTVLLMGARVLVVVVGAALVVSTLAGASAGASGSRLRVVPVVSGLDAPVAVAFAPGWPRRIHVAEQGGLVRVIDHGRLLPAPLADLRVRTGGGGEQGLLGLAFDPRYRTTGALYVNFTRAGDGATVIGRLVVKHGRAMSFRKLLRVAQPHPNHNGGHLAFGPDGLLWVGLGDGGGPNDPDDRAQARGTLLGKLFTLDVRKRAPRPVIVGYGLRNPWRYSFDSATGDLWIGDVGQEAVEEVSVLRAGRHRPVNFGWDVYEGRLRHERTPLGPGALIAPIAQYGRYGGCSVVGGFVYRGIQIPALRGRYVFGDYCTGRVWSLPSKGGRVRREPVVVPGLVSFGEGPAGELLLLSHRGTLYRLVSR